jgi:hypothetical protein
MTKFTDIDVREIQAPTQDTDLDNIEDDNGADDSQTADHNNTLGDQIDSTDDEQEIAQQNIQQSDNDVVTDSQPLDDNPTPGTSGTQVQADREISKLCECKHYKGSRWYRTKFVDQRLTEWLMESQLPKEKVQEFHISKTQKGKARKRGKQTSH